MENQNVWLLIDCRDEVTYEENPPQTEICSESDLRRELGEMRRRSPSIVQLHSPEGEILIIGIGGPFAGLRWMKPPMVEHFKLSLNPMPPTNQGIEFRDHGTDTGFRPQYLFPLEDVIEEAVYFYNNQTFSDRMQWRSIGRLD
jgi:hypothetical protein